eukprot:2162919-Prymnesium_polylepis.1
MAKERPSKLKGRTIVRMKQLFNRIIVQMESMTLRVPALDRQRTAWGQACAQTERRETRTKMIESTR